MKVTVTVDIPNAVLFKVNDFARDMLGRNPTESELVKFFEQDIDLCYEQYAGSDDLEDAVQSFFYVEEETE